MKDLLFKSEFYEDVNYMRIGIGLLLLIILSKTLQIIYTRYSDSPTNKKNFSSIFVLFAVSIFLIVTTIKSSLALSLGMVGALSIIRFRTAIKEPEQLIYFLGLTGVSIAIAAEKEILALLVVIIFILSAFINYKSNSNKEKSEFKHIIFNLKINESHSDIDIISKLIETDDHKNLKCKNFYEDNSGNLRVTFSIGNSESIDMRKIKETFRLLDIEEYNVKIID